MKMKVPRKRGGKPRIDKVEAFLIVTTLNRTGKMGLASLGKGRALLELEFVEEARRVLISGKKAVGGVQLDLMRWSPRSGCLEEGEVRKEVWVRILGLPISLWVPSVLRRVGDACGGFLDIDPQTESMEELQWARILVKSDGKNLPG